MPTTIFNELGGLQPRTKLGSGLVEDNVSHGLDEGLNGLDAMVGNPYHWSQWSLKVISNVTKLNKTYYTDKSKLTVLACIFTTNERWTNIARTSDSEGISCAGTSSSIGDKARRTSSSQNWTGKGMCSQIVSDTANICTAWANLVSTRGSQSGYTTLDNVTIVGGWGATTSKRA